MELFGPAMMPQQDADPSVPQSPESQQKGPLEHVGTRYVYNFSLVMYYLTFTTIYQ